jgi:NAD(P)-dependent dehydrogenase (short-subunit alcohol dehydrogenase family)
VNRVAFVTGAAAGSAGDRRGCCATDGAWCWRIGAEIGAVPDGRGRSGSMSAMRRRWSRRSAGGGGRGRLDALVCNAAGSANTKLETLSLAAWNSVIARNLTGPFLLAREAAGLLRAAGGSIVTIASTRAHMSEAGMEAYSASKGGLLALSHALAASLAPVRVNCISPGGSTVAGRR